MPSSALALQTSIFATLGADANVLALLGAARIHDQVPQPATYPYISFGQSTTRDADTGTEASDEHLLTLHIWSRAEGRTETHKLIDAGVLAALGSNGYLINVARGSVVDQAALVDALQRGVIAGAGLDVFENEPEVPEAMWAMDNVLLTPHIGSATSQTRAAMADLAFRNLQACFAGGTLPAPVPECQ